MKPGRLQQRMEAAANRLAKAVTDQKSEWLDNQMKRIMPPEIFALSEQSKSNQKNRNRVIAWMAENNLKLHEFRNGRTLLVKGEVVLSEFVVRFQDGKAEFMVKDYEL